VPDRVLETGRCDRIQLEPMSKKVVESIEEVAVISGWLKQYGLYDAALEVFGGSALMWTMLARKVQQHIAENGKDDIQQIVEQEILNVIDEASNTFGQQVRVDKNTSTIAALYNEHNAQLSEVLIDNLGPRPSPDKVFRIHNRLVQPVTRAMHYTIKYGRDRVLRIEDIKRMVEDELRQ
jgi:hypothetical protein